MTRPVSDAASRHWSAPWTVYLGHPPSDVDYDIYRAACVKEFELALEQSGTLLRKRLSAYFASNLKADRLPFKDLFRHAARYGLIEIAAAERWLSYIDTHNTTSDVDGEHFAEATLNVLPSFIADARALEEVIEAAEDG